MPSRTRVCATGIASSSDLMAILIVLSSRLAIEENVCETAAGRAEAMQYSLDEVLVLSSTSLAK